MFKPLAVSAESVLRAAQPAMPEGAVNNVFKVMHGFYGNLFLAKFATGEVDEAGQDKGIVSARQIWGHGLREFDAATVKSALAQCMDRHPEFPPSLPQFVALCRACQPRQAYKPEPAALGMSRELRSQYSRKAREAVASRLAAVMDTRTGYVKLPQSLDGLKQAIANAVATAGGDEAAELIRLDRMFARPAA